MHEVILLTSFLSYKFELLHPLPSFYLILPPQELTHTQVICGIDPIGAERP